MQAQGQPEPAQQRWGSVLQAADEGLRGGQLFLWNEASRKVEALLACPPAFEGEVFAQVSLPAAAASMDHPEQTQHQSACGQQDPHQVACPLNALAKADTGTHAQVMQWLQAACLLGQAFCGPAGGASSLHRLVMQHGAASFQRMHTSNLETLHSLLERELWRSVPLPPSQSACCCTCQSLICCHAQARLTLHVASQRARPTLGVHSPAWVRRCRVQAHAVWPAACRARQRARQGCARLRAGLTLLPGSPAAIPGPPSTSCAQSAYAQSLPGSSPIARGTQRASAD